MPVSHEDFFATRAQPPTANLRGEYADVLQARGLMVLLYQQAALLVMAARARNIQAVLTEWTTRDRFEIKVGLQTVLLGRERAEVTISFANFARGSVSDSPFALVPEVGEKIDAFAERTMLAVRAAFWPDAQ